MWSFKKLNFEAAIVRSTWIRITFRRSISEYNFVILYRCNFIKFKTFIKGLIVVDKKVLKIDPFFSLFQGQYFDICRPTTHNFNSDKNKVGIPPYGTEGKSTSRDS